MSAIPKQQFTEAEYLALESNSELKHEYFHGEIFAMSGASPEHDRITLNIQGIFYNQLRGGPCQPFSSDMRVRISSHIYTYPDISVICGEAEFTQDSPPSLTNPTLIIEILSPSTESYDRGTKFQSYQSLESLREYVLIAQDKARIETFTRNADNAWVFEQAIGLESAIDLTSIQCRLVLADIYERITLPEEQIPTPPEF